MNHSSNPQTSTWSATALAKMALVTALYVVVTVLLAPLSFGPIQLRLAELFNYLGVFNKRYIWSITLGVAIANTASPLGIIDIVIGSAGTCAVLWIAYFATKNQQNLLIKLMLTAILFALSMFTVAGPLTFFYQLPFWYTWLAVGLGELLSMTVGGILIYVLNKKNTACKTHRRIKKRLGFKPQALFSTIL
ncbi:QueT transporter family protein [Enterococcus faecalis]|uniref:QueT transporter family protein n=1 Tax=Enterococcus faecalis TaxID=1351 RepID=UPI0029C97241|nr:QueT transporter family protein [Enterococcus faecalis]WPH36520.1 QueT transporter family protein [Enterococcus faecalis]